MSTDLGRLHRFDPEEPTRLRCGHAARTSWHRKGVGRALIAALEHWLGGQGVEFLQVKTLSARSASSSYAKTRAFYLGMGFVPLEEFPTLWDEQNPCLMLIKRLPESGRPQDLLDAERLEA